MKRVKFKITFNCSIEADDTWDEDEMAQLAGDLVRYGRFPEGWSSEGLEVFSISDTDVEQIEKEEW